MQALTTTGKPVRTIPSEIGIVIPVTDIVENIGYSRSSITKAITENPLTFKGFTSIQSLPTAGGIQKHLCLNKNGLERLLLIIRPAKTKGELCERIEAFRIKAFGRMERNEVDLPEPVPLIQEEIDRAKLLAEVTGGNLREFQKIALMKCGYGDYAKALDEPAITHGETGWYNPTRLITLCNDPDLTPERLNWYLHNKGFQYRDGYIWRLTDTGKIHGMEYQYEAPSGHREIRIRWRESILYASGLKKEGVS